MRAGFLHSARCVAVTGSRPSTLMTHLMTFGRLVSSLERRRRFSVVNVAALNSFFSERGQDASTRERQEVRPSGGEAGLQYSLCPLGATCVLSLLHLKTQHRPSVRVTEKETTSS